VRAATDRRYGVPGLLLEVHDDGPGVPANRRAALTARGVSGDPGKSGQGIGLAVVKELVEEGYAGRLQLSDSPLGGLNASVFIPRPG
jgi:two-component system sensor histidine kinase PhoQ